MHGDERLEHQVVAGPQVGAFVAQYRLYFGVAQRRQRALAQHDPAADAGQTVGQRFCDVDDPNARPVAVITEQIHHHPVMGPAAAGFGGHDHRRGDQSHANQKSQREDHYRAQPQRPAQGPDLRGRTPIRLPAGMPRE